MRHGGILVPSGISPESDVLGNETPRSPALLLAYRGSFHTYDQGGLQGVTLCSHAVPPTPLDVPACARPLGMPRGLCYGQL